MKALRKEPEHRYRSVEHLIEDLNRHLNQEPVEARQGNRWYHHATLHQATYCGVIAGTAALMGLIAVAIILSIQANRLKEQRDLAKAERDKATQENQRAILETSRAESVAKFMEEVLTATDPYESQERNVTAEELLDRAARRIENDHSEQPEVRAELLFAIGKAYENQEQIDRSIPYLKEALELQKRASIKNDLKLATILVTLGSAYNKRGQLVESDVALSEGREMLELDKRTYSPEYLQLLSGSGWLAHRQNQLERAHLFYTHALDVSRRIYGNTNVETANVLKQAAQVMIWESNYTEAEKYIREAISIYEKALPERHPDRIGIDVDLGELLYFQGKTAEAETVLKKALVNQKITFGPTSSWLLGTYDELSKVHIAQRRWNSAEADARNDLSIAISTYGKNNFNTGVAHSVAANVFLKTMDPKHAEEQARISLSILKADLSPDHQYIASAEYLVAASLVAQHKSEKAEAMIRENIARWNRAKAPTWRAARTESLLGIALLQLHKLNEAKQHLLHADGILLAKDSGAFPNEIATAHKRVEEFQRCETEHHLDKCELTI